MKTLIATAVVLAGMVVAAGSASAATPFECQQYATNYAEAQYPTGGGAIKGGIIGGILGAGLAGVTGNNVGTGAGVGAGLGLVVGSAEWQTKKNQAYQAAYDQCLGGGQPVYAPAPTIYAPVYPVGPFNAQINGASVVNVRSGPGTQFGVLAQVYQGQTIGVQGCGDGWCALAGGSGFVSQTYVYPL